MSDTLPPIKELDALVQNNTAFRSWDTFRQAMQPNGYDQAYTPTLRTDVRNAEEVRRLRAAVQALGFKVWPLDPKDEPQRLADMARRRCERRRGRGPEFL